jgi:hypothetical protein
LIPAIWGSFLDYYGYHAEVFIVLVVKIPVKNKKYYGLMRVAWARPKK